MRKTKLRLWQWLFYAGVLTMLSGCSKLVLFNTKGVTGVAERDILILASVIMLLVIVPVIFMAVWFPYKYREKNDKANYDPKFIHSNKIEAFVWGIPIVIVGFLAYVTYVSSHDLDPYKPLESEHEPLVIQVVSLSWKWLFIYPEQGIATINEIYFPKDVPINFKVTSDAPMNSFFIPQLGGQIYAMAGMQTQLHLEAFEEGTYRGLSSNYSGVGFAGMSFTAVTTKDRADFDAWVEKVRTSNDTLNDARYNTLVEKSQFDPVTYFGQVKPEIFQDIIWKYAAGSHGNAHPKSHTQQKPHSNIAYVPHSSSHTAKNDESKE